MLLFDNFEVSYTMPDYGNPLGSNSRMVWHNMNTPSDVLSFTFDIGEYDPMEVMITVIAFVYDPESEYAWENGYRPITGSGMTYGENCPDGWDTEVNPEYSEEVEAVLVVVDVCDLNTCYFTVGIDD